MKAVKLGDIIKLEYGKPLPPSDRKIEGNFPAYGANGIKARTDRYFYDQPSIIIGRKGSAGELTLTNSKFWPLDVTYFVTHDESKTDILYIYHLLKTLNLPSLARGVKPGINRNDIYAIKVNIPEIEEQRRIVARLNAAFERITKVEVLMKQNLDSVSLLQKSILAKCLDIDTHTQRLGDICMVLGGKRIPKGEKLLATPTDHPYIRVRDFDNNGSVDSNDLRYVPDKIHGQISRYIITKNDVFLSIAGTIGVTGIVPDELDGANLTENACRLVPSNYVDKKYLYYFTTSESFRSQAFAEIKQTAQPKLALTRVKSIRMPLPSKDEQIEVVNKLDDLFLRISDLHKSYIAKLTKVAALRQSLLAEAFTTTALL